MESYSDQEQDCPNQEEPLPQPPANTADNKQATNPIGSSFLMLSIFTLVLGFLPLSVFALYNSIKAYTAFKNEDYETGHRYAKRARWCAIVSLIIGCIFFLILLGVATAFEIMS